LKNKKKKKKKKKKKNINFVELCLTASQGATIVLGPLIRNRPQKIGTR
jgi:hypothetical protein